MSDKRLGIGTKHCLCSACGEYFTNVVNFDFHRTGKAENRRCVFPGGLVNKKGNARLRLNARGLWARTGGVYIPGVV